jgi:hypothetical protein
MTKILDLVEEITSCRDLDDLQTLLGRLERRRDLTRGDERVLRPHLQAAARRLMRSEKILERHGAGLKSEHSS